MTASRSRSKRNGNSTGSTGTDDAVAAIARLAAALATYAPARAKKLRPARSLAALEKLVEVPAGLRALWAWADGAADLIVPDAGAPGGALDLLSAKDAASTLVGLREPPGFPAGLCPFASDGAGNYLAADAKGRVFDWDHETRRMRAIARSVAAVLARSEKALAAEELFGGPEVGGGGGRGAAAVGAPRGTKPAKLDPRVAKAEKLLAAATPDLRKLRDAIAPLAAPARCRLLAALRDKLLAADAPERELTHTYEGLAIAAAEAGAYDDAIDALTARGDVYDPHDAWKQIGRIALEAGALAPAARAFAKGESLEATIGAAVVASLARRDPARPVAVAVKKVASELQRIERRLAPELAAGRGKLSPDLLDTLGRLLVHRATLEQVAGDRAAARATLAAARATCGERAKGQPRSAPDAYARAVGLGA